MSESAAERPLILFNDSFFGRPPDMAALEKHDSCEFTLDRRRFAAAAAVIFHTPSTRGLKGLRKRPGQLWVAWSMESEANYPLLADRAFMAGFDLTMTYKRSADIWTSYLPGVEAFERALAAPLPPKDADAPLVMFQSAALDRSGRNRYALELMQRVGVHSYGNFLKNRSLPEEDRGLPTKLSVIGRYKFCIAFENSLAQDYVTEKFFDPLRAGTVPVYLGAPNVAAFAPGDDAYIDVADFSGPAELADHLSSLCRDDAAYLRHLAWRARGLSPQFTELASRTGDPFGRLCEIVAARGALRRWRWPWSR
jgi:hypothetical protein